MRLLITEMVFLATYVFVIPAFDLAVVTTSSFPKETPPQARASPKTILFFGNSLSAGFGLDPAEAFPALIQQKIDSLKWHYTVVNAGLSGETSAGGLRRIDWLLQRKIDVLVLELGANDGLRGIALADTRRNLQGIIDRTKEKHPHAQIVIAGMQVPPNLGKTYTQSFRALFPELAKKNEAALIPFLLEGVGGVPELNLADGIHPNISGHRKVAENVWKVLRPLLVHKK
ncbi:MAG: arylesterase [bacterium]